MLQKYEDIQIITKLDQTHNGTTNIILGKYNEQLLICKSIMKSSFKDSKSIQHVMNQKNSLKYFTQIKSKGINKIKSNFQDKQNIYLILDPVQGLPLHKLLQMTGKFNQQFTFIIVAQIGLILKDFHQNGYIYRDIKASNFMINQKGKITMIDLGLSKKIMKQKTYTICGTTHSMPPQIYSNEGYSYQFDYYGFGILIYQLLTGKAPFGYGNVNPTIIQDMKQGTNEQILSKIQKQQARDLIKRLLANKQQRLGKNKGWQQILQHQYFNIPEFCDAKDIYDEVGQINQKDQAFQFYISQIRDFGIQYEKYDQITPEDPFYKFFD